MRNSKNTSQGIATILAIASVSVAFLAGCKEETPQPSAVARPALEVGVLEMHPQSVELKRELPGRTLAFRVAEVRARVNGIVLKRYFEEGSDIEEGALLYQIDPAPYQAVVDSAKANLAQVNANVAFAKQQEKRMRTLLESSAVSQQDYDSAKAACDAAVASVEAAEAAVRTAEINLGYTQVTSPISGRIGLSQVTEGAYVQAGTATLMATVQQLDPMYVNLVQPSSEAIRLKKALEKGSLSGVDAAETPVHLTLENGDAYGYTGKIQFSDVTVDARTGAVTMRVLVPNPDMDLLPGLFVRAEFAEAVNTNAVLVPQEGVSRNYRGEPTVWLAKDGIAKRVVIETSRTTGDQWIVTGGLNPGDLVILSNLQKLRPETPVKTIPWEKTSSN